MRKYVFGMVLSLLLLFAVTGCGGWEDIDPLGELSAYYQEENNAPLLTAVTSFTLPYYAQKTLDPITCDDGIQRTVSTLLYEGLYRLDQTFTPQPVLATSHQYDSETYTYTIYLRSDAVFSDGSPVTAQDVAATLERARLSERYLARLRAVEKITTQKNAVVIQLEEDNRSFLARLDIPIVKDGTEKNTVPTGSGPYVWVVGEGGPYLTPSPLWWKNETAPLAQIDLQAYKSADAAVYAFTAREVQLLSCDLTGSNDMPSTIVGDYADVDTTVLAYLSYNVNSGIFADRSLRAAVSAAIDREELISAYLMGHGCATQFPIHPRSELYPAELEKEYQSDSFYQALSELDMVSDKGWLSANLLVNEENDFKVSLANKIAEALDTGDLHVTVVTLPWEEYVEAIYNQEYDLFLGEVKMTADWDATTLFGGVGAMNFAYYYNPDMDDLLAEYLSASEESRPLAAEKLCRFMQSEAPITPLFFKKNTVLTTADLITDLHPTEADPFYDLSSWEISLTK